MSRIELTDNAHTVLAKMSDGNPGALTVLMNMMKPEAQLIDPDSALGWVAKVSALDALEIYGSDIYVLHADICDGDLVKTFAVLRAYQLGLLEGTVLKDACSRQDRSGKGLIPVDDLYSKIKEVVPNFNNTES